MSAVNNKAMAKEYLERQIMNASPAERIVLCYDGAIRFLLAARRAIEEENIQERFNNNKRAGDVIAYLLDTLDMQRGGDVATRLNQLYNYMLRRLMDVDLKNDLTAVDDVVTKLRELRVSWEKIARNDVPDAASESPAEGEGEAKAHTPVSAIA